MKLSYKVLLLTILIIPTLIPIIDTSFKTLENSNASIMEKVKIASVLEWAANGTAVCTTPEYQFYPKICTDGAGGAIITWDDFRGIDHDIYAQRVDSYGNMKWASNGIPICTAEDYQGTPQICSDGAGGAIITWDDERGIDLDIYAQRVDSNGNIMWNPNGTIICTVEDYQGDPQIISDGAGGAIITWKDHRSGSNNDIYVQHIDANGNVLWNPNGTAVNTAEDDQDAPQICSDGAGGAIITWGDYRNGSNWDIYVQRIDSSGNVLWAPNGTIICNLYSDQYHVRICDDQAGGAIITWYDDRERYLVFANLGVYAQRIDSNGNTMWTSGGKPICNEWLEDAWDPEICSDGAGGAIIAWVDEGEQIFPDWDIHAQRVDSNGNPRWAVNGTAICTADERQNNHALCKDGKGGAFITWEDERSGTNIDIYVNMLKLEKEEPGISFGSYFIMFTIISLFSLIIVMKRRLRINSKL